MDFLALTAFLLLSNVGVAPSSVTRRITEGNEKDYAFSNLMRTRMSKVARIIGKKAVVGSSESKEVVATLDGLSPKFKQAKKVKGLGQTPYLAADLEGILGGHFSHATRAFLPLE